MAPRRFPKQPAVYHESDVVPSAEIRAEFREGRAVTVSGSLLAMVEYATQRLGHNEGIWFYGASVEEPEVLRHMIIPRQTVSPGHCRTAPGEALAAGRLAQRNGWVVKATGHSHGGMGVFVSATDESELRENATQGVSWTAHETSTVPGIVKELPPRPPGRRESGGDRT